VQNVALNKSMVGVHVRVALYKLSHASIQRSICCLFVWNFKHAGFESHFRQTEEKTVCMNPGSTVNKTEALANWAIQASDFEERRPAKPGSHSAPKNDLKRPGIHS